MNSHRPTCTAPHFRSACRLRATLAGLLLALGAAGATPALAEPPMWVVRDANSTIYLFGTAHLMDPTLQWRTARVDEALRDATQLWVEIAIPAGGELQMAMSMLQRAMSPGQTLSSRLTEAERARLAQLLARHPQGQQLATVLEMTRPWFATLTLGVAPLMAAGYDANAGADTVLMQLARAQGDAVLGLETAEQQIEWLASAPDAAQLAALQALLAIPDAEFDAAILDMDQGVRAWMRGDIRPLEALTEGWRSGADDAMSAGMSYEQMIVRRNDNWAQQIDQLLQGEGVAFVAVGAGHLVGPDSLQSKLAARGIKAERH